MRQSKRRTGGSMENVIIEVRPASLVGAAQFLREVYQKDDTIKDTENLTLYNETTGEMDFSKALLSRTGSRKYRSVSKVAAQKNLKRRAKYRDSRDKQILAKIAVEVQ